MRALLDTHTLLWVFGGDPRLGPAARALVDDARNTVLVSAVSVFEIANKVRIGKLPMPGRLLDDFSSLLKDVAFEELPLTSEHMRRAGLLPWAHRDPFDRMLAAQAQAEGLVLVSSDDAFDAIAVPRVW